MISFEFTGAHVQLRTELGEAAQAELAPRYQERAWRANFPWGAHHQLAELGVLEVDLTEELGDTGGPDPIALRLATETLAHGDVNVASAPFLVGLVAPRLAANGQHAVAEEYFARLISGEIAVTEPPGGSDVSNLTTTARPVRGGWWIFGEKIAIPHALSAFVALVYAREPGSQGYEGMSCFLVPLDAEGVSRSHVPGMGALPLSWSSKAFDNVMVPKHHLVGEYGHEFAHVIAALRLQQTRARPLPQRYRDVPGYLTADGTTGIQKRIISTSMFRKAATL